MAATISLAGVVYTERSRGVYTAATATFGAAQNEIRVRPNTNQKQPSITITRYRQILSTTTVGTVTTTKLVPVSISLSVNMAKDPAITSAILVAMKDDIAKALTAGNFDSVLQGSTEVLGTIA